MSFSSWICKSTVIHLYNEILLLLLLLLSHFSRVRLCATPEMAAHQAPPSLGFSRQEHWSGSPFPSPMHESEKWKWSRSVMSDPPRPHGLQPTRLLHPWDSPGKSTGVGCHCILQMKYYSALKRNELSSHEKTWRNLKCILLSERSQSGKAKYWMIPTIRHSRKDKTMEMVKRSVDS